MKDSLNQNLDRIKQFFNTLTILYRQSTYKKFQFKSILKILLNNSFH